MSAPFRRVHGELRCGDVSLAEFAERFGTPLYVYDIRRIEERLRAFQEALEPARPLVAYSVKANGNLAILNRLARLGAGADVVSLGELFRAVRGGVPAHRIVYSGVAKTREEHRAGLEARIHAFNVESSGELRRLESVARELGVTAPFAVRVNPDVDAKTPHPYTRTGKGSTKFGVPPDEALEMYGWARGRAHLKPRGIDVHIGSQILDTAPYRQALETVLSLADEVQRDGTELEFVDLGGGFGVGYERDEELSPRQIAAELLPRVLESGLRLVVEPGRSIVGDAGVLVTRVQYLKSQGERTFVVVDGGMSELLRPSHYGGYHAIEAVRERSGAPEGTVDVVGPICEAGDFLARDRLLPLPEPGDLLAVMTAGAYGFTMSSNYNARRRPAEALVDGDQIHLVRERECLDDLIRGELIPAPPSNAPEANPFNSFDAKE